MAQSDNKIFFGSVKSTSAFTLVELIVVIAIIAILAAVSLPGIKSWLPDMRLKSAARDIYSNLQKAKSEAIKRNLCVGASFSTVAFPAQGGSYTIFIDDGTGGGVACNRTLDGAESVLGTASMPDGISLVSASFTGGASGICFTGEGVTCSSKTGSIQVRNTQSRWYKVSVSAAGGLRLEISSDGSSWKQ